MTLILYSLGSDTYHTSMYLARDGLLRWACTIRMRCARYSLLKLYRLNFSFTRRCFHNIVEKIEMRNALLISEREGSRDMDGVFVS